MRNAPATAPILEAIAYPAHVLQMPIKSFSILAAVGIAAFFMTLQGMIPPKIVTFPVSMIALIYAFWRLRSAFIRDPHVEDEWRARLFAGGPVASTLVGVRVTTPGRRTRLRSLLPARQRHRYTV